MESALDVSLLKCGIHEAVSEDETLGQEKVHRSHVGRATKKRLQGRVQAVLTSGRQRDSVHP